MDAKIRKVKKIEFIEFMARTKEEVDVLEAIVGEGIPEFSDACTGDILAIVIVPTDIFK